MVPPPPFDAAFNDASSTIPGHRRRRANGGAGTLPGDLDAAESDLEPPIPRSARRRIGQLASPRLLAVLTTLALFALFAGPTQAASIDSRAAVLDGRPTRVLEERDSPFYGFAPTLTKRQDASTCACSKTGEAHNGTFVVEAIFIPILVLLSGAFAGLTLGYMSLDSTQLNVLAKSGTEEQKRLAQKIIPIRKDGHLLLITLLIANMICNEARPHCPRHPDRDLTRVAQILPIVSDPVLGGGVQAVVVSTVLIVIFSEIVPQSVCSRFGLQIGAFCTIPVRGLVYLFYPVTWPIARLLTKVLGAHSGVIYRRAELKELVNLHGLSNEHGGDLNRDVVTIVGATLDLQEKRVRDAMTPISKAFMLNIDSKLDYETIARVVHSGHSRIPVYEEVEGATNGEKAEKPSSRRKILGVLLTKQLILIDPEDALPLRDFPLHPLPLVSDVQPLLQILNSFQEGRSHLAIVCPRKPGFFRSPTVPTQGSPTLPTDGLSKTATRASTSREDSSGDESGSKHKIGRIFRRRRSRSTASDAGKSLKSLKDAQEQAERGELELSSSLGLSAPLEEDLPMGIITLEDVIEELLGEEILDETDKNEMGETAVAPYLPEEAVQAIQKPKPMLKIPFRPKMPSTPVPTMTPMTPGANLGPQATPLAAATATSPTAGPPPTKATMRTKATKLSLGSMPRSRSAPGKSRTPATEEPQQTVTTAGEGHESPVPEPSLPQITERGSTDEAAAAAAAAAEASHGGPLDRSATPSGGRVPPRLSDAILLERGRRHLVRQGVDPNVTLRLAQPSSSLSPSQPADGSTPIIAVPPVSTPDAASLGSSSSKGAAFKLPTRRLSVPQRSLTGTPRASTAQDGSGGRTPASSTGPEGPLTGSAPLVESPPPEDTQEDGKGA